MDVVQIIAEKLGVEEDKARAALGIILVQVKKYAGPEKFDMVANNIPQVQEIMDAAPKGGFMGMLTGMFGKGGGLAGAMSQFSKLGLGPDDAMKTVDGLQEHLKSDETGESGNAAADLLGSFLGK